jgi:hypothetical protein
MKVYLLRDGYLIPTAGKRREILKWLSLERFNDAYDIFQSRRVKKSGIWLLQSQEFQDWFDGISSLFIVSGIRTCSF